MCDHRQEHKVQKACSSGENSDVTLDQAPEMKPTKRRQIKLESVLVSLGILVGVAFVIFGFNSATTGRDALGYPDEIIEISPAPNDRQVLSQTEISVNLQDGYEAVLVLDGIEIPTTRLEDFVPVVAKPGQQFELPPTAIYDQGNSLIRFEPTTGAVIEMYSVGVHKVKCIFWRIEDGRQAARSFEGSFEVL